MSDSNQKPPDTAALATNAAVLRVTLLALHEASDLHVRAMLAVNEAKDHIEAELMRLADIGTAG